MVDRVSRGSYVLIKGDGMSLKIMNRREDRRFVLPTHLGAEIEFTCPDGGRYRLPLLEISGLGLAFFVPEEIPGIGAGVMLADTQIQVGNLVIRGNLSVQHTLAEHPSNHKCGAQFYPASDEDRNELVGLLARLESLSKTSRT